MKKMTYFVMALALVLGFTQCKKEQTPANNQTESVFITLDVNGGNNNSRVIVDPVNNLGTNSDNSQYATVSFEQGDVIYVGNNGAYCGYLVYDGTTNKFSGSIDDSNLSEADYLHFYFMGNKGPADSEPTEAVSITDQTVKYPVISYAHSTVKYASGTTSYSAKLQNYCAIVKFTTNSIPTATAVTVKGMKNTVAVNFGANNAATSTSGSPYTFTKSGDGDIILHAVSTSERWAILLEQDEVTNATVTASGYNNGTCNVPEITNNMYYTTGVDITLAPAADYVFSVSSTQTVHFSPGNLQYKVDEGWRFAEHQYDYIESWWIDEWVDHFGWGTWGSGKDPLNESTASITYTWSSDFQGTLNGHSDWRTLTKDEWIYLLGVADLRDASCRTNATNLRKLRTVHGVYGLVIMPDGFDYSTTSLDSDWNVLETAGAVFLPAAGSRYGSDDVTEFGETGQYWSSTADGNKNAWYVYFPDEEEMIDDSPMQDDGRCVGCSVRLVRDAN